MPEQTSQTRPRQRQREQVLIAWADALMSTTSHYLVKGILPRTGLAVVWGPPKCGKSFWTFDVTVHIALGEPVVPLKLTVPDPGTAVIVPLPHEPDTPFGVATTSPAGS